MSPRQACYTFPQPATQTSSQSQPGRSTPRFMMENRNSISSFPFLRLPGEIRNIVYRSVFHNTQLYIWLSRPNAREPGTEASRISDDNPSFALTYTCRQIHAEAHILPYMHSIFSFKNARQLEQFMFSRSKAQRAAIQYMELRTICGALGYLAGGIEPQHWALCMAGMTGLKVIRILEYSVPGWVKPMPADIIDIVSTCNMIVQIVAQDVYQNKEDIWFTSNKHTAAALDGNST